MYNIQQRELIEEEKNWLNKIPAKDTTSFQRFKFRVNKPWYPSLEPPRNIKFQIYQLDIYPSSLR